MGAAVVKQPHWNLSEEEAARIATATKNLQEQYSFDVDPKTQAWIFLAATCGMAYGPRVLASVELARQAKKRPVEPPKPVKNVEPQERSKQSAPMTPSEMIARSGGSLDDYNG